MESVTQKCALCSAIYRPKNMLQKGRQNPSGELAIESSPDGYAFSIDGYYSASNIPDLPK
jgi:hypothetical protein